MTFHDFVIDTRLEQHNEEEPLRELEIVTKRSKEVLGHYLSKERILEHQRINQDPSRSHFFHEFPRKQSNNDLQYHTDDVVINFLVNWFFIRKPKDK